LSFDEKSDNGGSGWINAGRYLLSHHLLLTIPTSKAVSLEREMFPAWMGQRLYGYRSAGRQVGTDPGFDRGFGAFADASGFWVGRHGNDLHGLFAHLQRCRPFKNNNNPFPLGPQSNQCQGTGTPKFNWQEFDLVCVA